MPRRVRVPAVFLVGAAAIAVLGHADAQNWRRLRPMPDIPGYITVKADFHLHSVFSDG